MVKDRNTVTDCTKDGISGSPVSIPVAGECKFVRLALRYPKEMPSRLFGSCCFIKIYEGRGIYY